MPHGSLHGSPHHSGKKDRRRTRSRSPRHSRRHRDRRKSDDADWSSQVRGHHSRERDSNYQRNRHNERRAHRSVADTVVHVKEEPLTDDEGRHRQHPHATHRSRHSPKEESNAQHANSRTDNFSSTSNHDDSKKDKDAPNFELSGKLAEDTNMYNGIVIKYNEPEEARKPRKRWRLYPFKGEEALPMLPIHRQSAYLLGRERRVADIPVDHPSCSKQHAVLQYRMISYEREDGKQGRRIRPYIIDLDSANGTYINNKKIEPRRYVELMEKDVIKFGFSSREYVLLHEESKDDDPDTIEGDGEPEATESPEVHAL